VESQLKAKRLASRKEVDEESYAKMVQVANLNRDEGQIEARNVNDAVKALEKLKPFSDSEAPGDQHPEKYTIYKQNGPILGVIGEEKPRTKNSLRGNCSCWKKTNLD